MEGVQPAARASRKRKRGADAKAEDSDDTAKKRGRPRSEKADQSAADRRRTQIRMAQRAYRQRKETTLDDLRKRVSDLTTVVECMNNAFENCRDRLVSAGLPEGQLHELAEVTVQFAGFMQAVRRPGDSDSDVLVERDTHQVNHVPRPTEGLPLVPKNVSSWIDQASLDHTERPTQRPDIGLGYSMHMPGAFDELVNNFHIPAMAQSMASPQQKHSSVNPFANPDSKMAHHASLSLDGEVDPPKTYSFHEKTLARRLHRACLEGAYQLLLDPGRRPHTFDRVFKLSLLSRDRARMAASIKRILDRGLDEPLELWDAPLLHIGGAGTHYPRREPMAQPAPRKPIFHLGMIGPQMLNLLESVVQARPAVDISIEVAGFEGEWFDPYDIEGYLEDKGVHIDPMVSFVEAEIEDSPSSSSTESSNSSTRNSDVPGSQSGASYWDFEQWSELQMLDADMTRLQEGGNATVSGLGNVGFSDASTGSWLNLQPMDHLHGKGSPTNMPLSQAATNALNSDFSGFAQMTPQKKVVIIDVAKFVKVLTVTGVCLGRTPGFRKKDVDHALAISSFDAF